jgi:hypothetical protein
MDLDKSFSLASLPDELTPNILKKFKTACAMRTSQPIGEQFPFRTIPGVNNINR